MSSEHSLHLAKTFAQPFDPFGISFRVTGENTDRNSAEIGISSFCPAAPANKMNCSENNPQQSPFSCSMGAAPRRDD
jgi:hypothetical protein